MIKPLNSSATIQTSTKIFSRGKLSVEIVGKEGEPLILLHGWGWHSGIWKCLISELSAYYQLFLVDLPGFGKSQFDLEDYTFAAIADLLFPLLPEQATWLGWSLGGMLATWIAIHFPEKVTRLITVATSPRFVQNCDWPGVPLKTLNHFSSLLLQNYEQTLMDFLELQLRGNPKNENLFSSLKMQLFREEKPRMSALLGGLTLLRDVDLRLQMRSLQCPSLFIFGSHDTLVPAKIAEEIPTLMTNANCSIMRGIGHMPFLLQNEFIKLIQPIAG